MTTNLRFRDWLDERMRDPKFRAAMEELEPAYQIARLRLKRGLTQKELAKLVGTKQSSIARLESGKSQPSISFLRRVAGALRAQAVIHIVAEEETATQADKVDAPFESRHVAATATRAAGSSCIDALLPTGGRRHA